MTLTESFTDIVCVCVCVCVWGGGGGGGNCWLMSIFNYLQFN